MADLVGAASVGCLQKPYIIYIADNGGTRFKLHTQGADPKFTLIEHDCPHREFYEIILKEDRAVVNDLVEKINGIEYPSAKLQQRNNSEFVILYYNGVIRMALDDDDPPFLIYVQHFEEPRPLIGYIKFQVTYEGNEHVNWFLQQLPYLPKSHLQKITGGKLTWVSMTEEDMLPMDAMIAGFEGDTLYVARAEHNGSLCPGKYDKSKKKAFVPWGGMEHAKSQFEVLCGYDVQWVACEGNVIPSNAFIGGTSELDNEPLYIGRATIDDCLITGKVHLRYKKCFLPYNGREVEMTKYEILVHGDIDPTGETAHSVCHFKDHPHMFPYI